MASDPNVGVPDANVVYSANVRVRAPERCAACEGEGWITGRIDLANCDDFLIVEYPCVACACIICGTSTDVIGGECGQCADEADRYAVRRADR